MWIVLDTNVLIADPWLSSAAFRVFIDGLPRIGATWCIPRLVLGEAVRRYRDQADDLRRRARSAHRKAARWLQAQDLSIELPEVDAAVHAYQQFLERTSAACQGRLLGLPDVSHDELVDRILRRRRPVTNKGDAYRDTLLWHSVLALMREGTRPVAFVSADKDFADGDALHSDLLDDVVSAGLDQNRLLFYRCLRDLNSQLVEPSLRTLREVDALVSARVPIVASIERSLPEDIEFNYADELAEIAFHDAFSDAGHKTVRRVRVHGVELGQAKRMSSGEIMIPAEVGISAELSVDVTEEEYRHSPELAEVLDGELSIDGEGEFEVTVRLLFDPNKVRITSVDVEGISAG